MSTGSILIERLDGHGRVQMRERFSLSDDKRTFTMGRSIHADVTLDDPFVAAMHASVEIAPDGRILANDLGSVNGLVVDGRRHRSARDLVLPHDTLQVGRTRLRVRTEQESLAPEKPDHFRPSSIAHDPSWITGIGALACGILLVYANWLGAPRDLAADIVASLVAAVLVAAVWVAFWGLLSRVMQGEWRWIRHSAILLGVAATFGAVVGTVDLGWFVWGLPSWSGRSLWIGAVALGCVLYLHLTQASNLSVRRAAQIASVVPILLAGGTQWLQERYQSRDMNYIDSFIRIYPPELRLRPADTVEAFFKNAATLRKVADQRLVDAIARGEGNDQD